MCCEFWDFVEKLSTTFEEIYILVHSFTDGVCSKLATIENEATAFEVIESQEKKEEKLLGTRSIHRLGGKGRVSLSGKGFDIFSHCFTCQCQHLKSFCLLLHPLLQKKAL